MGSIAGPLVGLAHKKRAPPERDAPRGGGLLRAGDSDLEATARVASQRKGGKLRTGEGPATAVSKRSLRDQQGLGRLPIPRSVP